MGRCLDHGWAIGSRSRHQQGTEGSRHRHHRTAEVTYPGNRLADGDVPDFDLDDEAVREALYGNFGHYKDWREVILANCTEIIRETSKPKPSEERIKNLARTHPLYLGFLATHFYGRAEYSRDKKKLAGGGYGA